MGKYNVNETFFDCIDSEEKAYWLGFIYADGCVTKDKKYLYINLSPTDINHLIAFNKCINSTYPIRHFNNYVNLRISNKHLVSSLISCGCVPCKSLILEFPNNDILPNNLIHHFIRGYFDGDGCLSTILRYKKNRISPVMECEINFLGTYDMLHHISDNIPIDNVKIFKFGNIYKFRIQSKKRIIDLMEYLYNGASIYLERKHEKYVNNVRNYTTKRHPLIPVTTTAV